LVSDEELKVITAGSLLAADPKSITVKRGEKYALVNINFRS